MSNSSILGGAPAPSSPSGKSIDALGPSDSSDSGSDVQAEINHYALPAEGDGALPISHDSTSDAAGTGERASVEAVPPSVDADLLPSRRLADVQTLAQEEEDGAEPGPDGA